MKSKFGVMGLLLICATTLFAATPTMKYTSQPSGNITSLPLTHGLHNLAPVPQILCSPTLSIGTASATCSGLPVCRGQKSTTASFSCSVSTTCNGIVPASTDQGGTCTLSLDSVKIDRSDRRLSSSSPVNFTVRYGSYTTPLTSSFTLNWIDPTPAPSSYRKVTFTNSCNYNIWFGSVSGAAPSHTIISGIDCTTTAGQQACTSNKSCYPQTNGLPACYSESCASDSDCVYGATCDTAKGLCFWNVLAPTSGGSGLAPGRSTTIQVPEYAQNDLGVTWSGNFGGRTGCTDSTCVSALCTANGENAQGPCSLGVGFQQPATEAEVTFLTYASPGTTLRDSYDVTVINGANVPMSMYPTDTSLIPTSGDPYKCGAPGYGTDVPLGGASGEIIGASSWNIASLQSNLAYVYVTNATSITCNSVADCSPGQNCGLAYTSTSIGSTKIPGQGYLVCGTFAGWLTADQICGTNNSFTTAKKQNGQVAFNFQCNDTPQGAIAPMYNLYQCNGLYGHSCYSDGADSNCCGCVNWYNEGTQVLVPSISTPYMKSCKSHNTTWDASFSPLNVPNVYYSILYLKQSCPSCYTYPFDDASSSFKCTNSTTVNTVDYTVEFCPLNPQHFQPDPK